MSKTYKIKYYFFLTDGTKVTKSPMKVKNCDSHLQAKIRLEDYLKKRNPEFGNLVVTECMVDYGGNVDDIFSTFNDIFGGKL